MGLSVAAQNAYLDNTLGPARGAASPAVLEIAAFAGDPENGGVEVSEARVDWDSDDWTEAENGRQYTDGEVQFATAADEWPDVATHWAGFIPGEDDPWVWDELDEELDVVAGPGPALILRLQHADAVAVEA